MNTSASNAAPGTGLHAQSGLHDVVVSMQDMQMDIDDTLAGLEAMADVHKSTSENDAALAVHGHDTWRCLTEDASGQSAVDGDQRSLLRRANFVSKVHFSN